MQNIPSILANLRATHSQSEIARATGISQPKLSRWEAGEIPASADDTLKLLAFAAQAAKRSKRKQRTAA